MNRPGAPSIISGPEVIDGYRVTRLRRADGSEVVVRVPPNGMDDRYLRSLPETPWLREDSSAVDRLLADVLAV